MRQWLKRSILSLVTIVLILIGIAIGPPLYARLTYDLQPLPADPRIFYEIGAEDLARIAAESLPGGLRQVASRHYSAFKDESRIRIYVFNDSRRRAVFGNTWWLRTRDPRGNANGDEIYISPRTRDGSLARILTHELSHVHMHQHLGPGRFYRSVPAWFAEGLAVHVSGGAGAEPISVQTAITALRSGRRFEPEQVGGIFIRKDARSYSMPEALFYRQAGLFVSYLETRDRTAFERALSDLVAGVEFRDIWRKNFNADLQLLWSDFLASVGSHNYFNGK